MIVWPQDIQQKFDYIIEKIPVFLRSIAKDKVAKKAEVLVQKEGRSEVTEKDLVDAFLLETPFGFHGPLKTDMQELGIDYTKYGHSK